MPPFPITPVGPFSASLPPNAFNNLISWAGINVLYMKNHNCPCIPANNGSPNPECVVCLGRGTFWDPSIGPFIVLMTLVTWIGRNVDMGENTDPNYGMIFEGHPILTIPATLEPLWSEANTNDIFVEIDAIMRFQADLRVGQQEIIPAWHILGSVGVAPTGAVIVEDPTIAQPVSGVTYTVSGGTVSLLPNSQYPNGYPEGTGYVVEYTSPPIFVINEPYGGLAHVRPFGQGLQYPRRWKTSLLDLWLRSKIGSSTNVQ